MDKVTSRPAYGSNSCSAKGRLQFCRGLVRGREEGFLETADDSPERGSQSRQVRQRQNPEKVSELTSITELLQEVTQNAHEGKVFIQKQDFSSRVTAVCLASLAAALLAHAVNGLSASMPAGFVWVLPADPAIILCHGQFDTLVSQTGLLLYSLQI